MSTRRTIICMKWGVKYGPDYANTLWRMLGRQFDYPFRLICFTDDHHGLRPEIEHRPLPEIHPRGRVLERGWNKLGVFHPKIDLPAEPILFLDLDVVLTGRMDVFFDVPGHFLISNDWNPRKPGVGNSSLFRFVPGTQDHLWQRFQSEPDKIRAKHRNDQEFISAAANGLGFWPDDLCRSYKRHCVPKWPMILWQTPRLPENARVLIFHGEPKPADAIEGVAAKWYRPIRPAPWLRDYIA